MSLAQFAREYRIVRRAEGWGSRDGAYYRALPYCDLTGRFPGIWKIRARSFDTFVRRVLRPLEIDGPLRIVDIGAGNGWLAHRLASRGHWVAAIDLLDDPLDGLGAARHYPSGVRPLLAEFDLLPFGPGFADLAVFNASLHYSANYAATLRETLRVLSPAGTLVILDSPMYTDPSSGARMVSERQSRFMAEYGFASDAVRSEHYLTPHRLRELAAEVGLEWDIYRPALAWRSRLERAIGGLRARREPARFPVIVGRRR